MKATQSPKMNMNLGLQLDSTNKSKLSGNSHYSRASR